jgi:Transcriptional regulator
MNMHRIDKLIRNFDWNLLHTYTVIVEEKSITNAANRLFLRQPTVSNALKRLEDYIDCTLIERSKGHFSLTPPGQLLYDQAKLITDNVGNMLNELQGSDAHSISGDITLAVASHIVFEPLDAFLCQFHQRYPDIQFSITVLNSNEVATAVKRKEASAGICLVHRERRSLTYQHLYREYFGFFCGPAHPLFGRENLSLNDLKDQTIVSFDTDRMLDVLRPVALFRHKAQLEGKTIGVSSNLEEVKRMIHCGMGYGPLPCHVVKDLVETNKLWLLPPYQSMPAVDAYVLTNDSMAKTQAEKVFLHEFSKMITSLDKSQKDLTPSFQLRQ